MTYVGTWIQRFPNGTLVEPRPTLLTLEEIERSTRELWMYEYVPSEGDTVLDVGAGTGWETLFFSRRVGRSGRVISIEAHPKVFCCLTSMSHINQLDNVTLVQAAIVDHEGEVLLSDFEAYEGNCIVNLDSGIPVAAMTLDRVFLSLQLPGIDLLKMNIEGAEKHALAGMREAIRKTKHVCISCHDFVADEGGRDEMRTKSEVIAFLKQNGFAVSLRESDARPNVRDYVYGLNQRLIAGQTGDDQSQRDAFPSLSLRPPAPLP